MTKPALKVFIWFFNLIFYLFIIAGTTITVVEIVRWAKTEHVASYSFNGILPHELKKITPEKHVLVSSEKTIEHSQIATGAWRISFESREPWIKFFMSLTSILSVLYVFFILLILRSFVMSLKNSEIFTLLNIRRLQMLGVLLLMIEPLSWLLRYARREWLLTMLDIEFANVSFSYRLGFLLGAREFVWNWIFAGLLVLVIAGVFKQGLAYKEEVDLTV